MIQSIKNFSTLKLALILLLGAVIFLFPISLPSGAGDKDLQAYWSSAYLFAHGQDFSDPVQLGEIERTLTTHAGTDTLYSWFSPIGNIVLLPFTLLPFTRTVSYWLVINIIVLFLSTLLIWGDTDRRKWIPLLAAFTFSMSIYSLVFGQINFLELLGLAMFLSLSRSGKPYLAGASLVLTTIKPHLVILTLPILLLDLLRKREWKVLAGFAIALLICFAILFAFYPLWMQSFLIVVASGMSNVRETPTINGLLVIFGENKIGKALWLIALITGILWWLKSGSGWDRRRFIDMSLIAGLILSPIGWSYDQIMLLLPILSLLAFVVTGKLPNMVSNTILAVLILANLLSYFLRIFTPSDVWFFWIPFVILILYLLSLRQIVIPQSPKSVAIEQA